MRKTVLIGVLTIFIILVNIQSGSSTETDFYIIMVSPTDVIPGETSTMNITIKNLGTTTASRIEASLDPEDTSPIDPIGPGRVQVGEARGAQASTYFGVVRQFEEIKISFEFNVNPSASEETYIVPLVLKWDSGGSTKKIQTLQLGLKVEDRRADFQVVNVEPEALLEGDTGTLEITIKNTGDNFATNLKATLDTNDITPIDPIGPTTLEFGHEKILPGDELKFEFPVSIKQNILEQVYYPPLALEWDDNTIESKSQIIQAGFHIKDPQSAIEVSYDSPEYITPGDEFSVFLVLKNTEGSAKNIDIIIENLESPLLSKSPNNIHLDELSSGETKRIETEFVSNKDMPTGLYSIPITLKYEGLDGQAKEQTENLPVEVKGLAKLNIASLKIEPQNPKKSEEVTIELRVENVGDDHAENAKVILDSELEGFKTAYLGELEKDDDTPAIFTLRATLAGEAINTLTLTYEDDFGEHSLSEEIRFNVSNNQTQNLGMILVVLLAVAAFIVYVVTKKRTR